VQSHDNCSENVSEPFDSFLQRIRDLRPDRSMPIRPTEVKEALRTAREPHWTAEERMQIYIALKRASAGDETIVRLIQARIDGLERPVTSAIPLRRLPRTQPGAGWRPWWYAHPDERYWLEVSDRDIVGDNLQGYCLDESGRTSQAYTLAGHHMRSGDTVYHFDKRVGAIVMKSSVAGECELEDDRTPEEAYWIVALSDAQKVSPPVTRAIVAKRADRLYPILESIRAEHPSPTYLPFTSAAGQLRLRQTYLTKMPSRIAEALALR
jgi:hypothetical protein